MPGVTDTPIAYELQARFAAGEAWITLDVCGRHAAPERGPSSRRDAWGRAPVETRVVAIHPRRAA